MNSLSIFSPEWIASVVIGSTLAAAIVYVLQKLYERTQA
jgi:hypothetical protein